MSLLVIDERPAMASLSKKRLRRRLSNSGDNGGLERKTNKTNVFSGYSKTVRTVSPLKMLCLEKLSQHFDKLVINQSINYDIIQPLLERCESHDLKRIEELNPWLTSQTERLWHQLCRNDFYFVVTDGKDSQHSNGIPNKMSSESWRQFYWRVMSDRKRKLEELTTSIKDKTASLKTTRKTTKVCETQSMAKISIARHDVMTTNHKKKVTIAPLMKKCLQMKRQKPFS
ncbi:elongin-A-like [Oppia nitens]|uniref:elongin-A-like n=1 Tax=Oppia nitens TaxID=1686743 RepID=UPI0023DCD5CB|nr:elongin-A-like [Oppia nitens]